MQIIPFPLKKRMLLHVEHNVEIARWPSERSGLTAAGKTDSGAVFHARGNFRVHRALAENSSVTFALQAGIGNHAARSLAGRTSPRDAEKPLLIAHLAPARARTASRRTLARRGSRSSAFLAGFVTAHHYASFGAECSFFELDG